MLKLHIEAKTIKLVNQKSLCPALGKFNRLMAVKIKWPHISLAGRSHLLDIIGETTIERFRSRDQQPYVITDRKESICIKRGSSRSITNKINGTLWERALLKTFQNLSVSSPAPVTMASPSGDTACNKDG